MRLGTLLIMPLHESVVWNLAAWSSEPIRTQCSPVQPGGIWIAQDEEMDEVDTIL